jgi:hypothetical protein
MKRCRPWSEEEEQLLLDLSAQGLSPSRLSSRLGRTTGAVRGRLYGLLRERAALGKPGPRSRGTASSDSSLGTENSAP